MATCLRIRDEEGDEDEGARCRSLVVPLRPCCRLDLGARVIGSDPEGQLVRDGVLVSGREEGGQLLDSGAAV